MKKAIKRFFLLLFLIGLGFLTFSMGSSENKAESYWPIAIYSVLITFFLAMQVYAFIISQVKYSYDIEEAKFVLLETEGVEIENCES